MSSGHAESPSPGGGAETSFVSPPVVEVALAVEFVPLPVSVLGARHLGQLVDLWAGEGSVIDEVPAAPALPAASADGAELQVSFSFTPPGTRFQVYAPGRALLVQVQNDRLILNWRRVDDNAEYPRFPALAEHFWTCWTDLLKSTAARSVAPQPLLAEVTYVNSIETPPELGLPFSLLEPSSSVADLTGLRFQYERRVEASPTDGGGAVVVAAVPQDSRSSTFHLTVSARLALHGTPGATEARGALDHAHRAAVEEFVHATRPELHARWGRQPS